MQKSPSITSFSLVTSTKAGDTQRKPPSPALTHLATLPPVPHNHVRRCTPSLRVLLTNSAFGYFHIWNYEHTKAFNQDAASTLGLKNVSSLEFPVISISGLIGTNLGPRDQNSNNITENYQWSDNVTFIRGNHIVKAGGNCSMALPIRSR